MTLKRIISRIYKFFMISYQGFWYFYREMPTMNLEKIYTSPYTFLLWHLFAQRVFYELSVVKVAIRLYDSIR